MGEFPYRDAFGIGFTHLLRRSVKEMLVVERFMKDALVERNFEEISHGWKWLVIVILPYYWDLERSISDRSIRARIKIKQ